MPVLHPVTEVRQWQRAAVQARRAACCWTACWRPRRRMRKKGGDPRRGGERGSPYGPAPGGQSGSVTQEILRAADPSYQPVTCRDWISIALALCCRIVGSSRRGRKRRHRSFLRPRQDHHLEIEHARLRAVVLPAWPDQPDRGRRAAPSPSSSSGSAERPPADGDRSEDQVSELCRGWPADRVTEIVTRHLDETIVPLVYAEARRADRRAPHGRPGRDHRQHSGQEMVAPIGAMLGASAVIATRMQVAEGRYTGEMDFYAYGEAKAEQVRELAAERGYRLPRLLRLQRLGHRPADAGDGRPPPCGQPRPGAAQDRPRARLAGARLRRWAAPAESPRLSDM